MSAGFRLFGIAHLALLGTIAGVAWVMVWAGRRNPRRAPALGRALGLTLAVNELIWWAFRYSSEGFRFPEGLPLQLCDVAVWITVAAAVGHNRYAVEFSYFAGLAGAGMALLTPDLWAPWPSYPSVYYFVAHGLVVITAAYLVWGLRVPISRHALRHFFVAANAYASLIGLFNWIFGANYLYLCRKPAGPTILDWFGGWPVYIVLGEAVALFVCWLLARLLPAGHHAGH